MKSAPGEETWVGRATLQIQITGGAGGATNLDADSWMVRRPAEHDWGSCGRNRAEDLTFLTPQTTRRSR
jgi:hypothetical protein